jgi:hypothetical protein
VVHNAAAAARDIRGGAIGAGECGKILRRSKNRRSAEADDKSSN